LPEKRSNPNPVITAELCEAYRKVLEERITGIERNLTEKINGIKNTIILGLSISTAVISLIVALLNML